MLLIIITDIIFYGRFLEFLFFGLANFPISIAVLHILYKTQTQTVP